MFVNSSLLLSGSNAEVHTNEGRRGLFISRPLSVTWSSRQAARCLRLSYHFAGDDCSLAVKVLSVDRSLSSVWSRNCGSSDASWRELNLSLSGDRPFQVSAVLLPPFVCCPYSVVYSVYFIICTLLFFGVSIFV